MNGHPQVEWRSEIFHEFHERDDADKDRTEPIKLLHQFMDQCDLPVFGFETKFQHLDSNGLAIAFDEYIELLNRMGFGKFIVLRRRNYLRQAISVARGQQSKVWHVKSDQSAPNPTPVKLDVTRVGLGGKDREILECFELLDQVYENSLQVLRAQNCENLQLNYEDDLEHNPQLGYQKMTRFLGVKDVPSQVSLQKLGGQPLEQMISNYAEIEKALSNTSYEWMIFE